MTGLERAKRLIEDYCAREFGEDAAAPDFSDWAKVPIAYTTTEDDAHEIQVYANLIDYQIETFVDGNIRNVEIYADLQEMIEDLECLDFDVLVGDFVGQCEDELGVVDTVIDDAKKRASGPVGALGGREYTS